MFLQWGGESEPVVDNNSIRESHEASYDRRVRVANVGQQKRAYNGILFILICKYNKKYSRDGGTARSTCI